MVSTARARHLEKHQQWAVLHSMSGYAIAIERALALGLSLVARIIHRLPDTVKLDWLKLPTERSDILDAEVGAFAWTVAAAIVIMHCWVYSELKPKWSRYKAAEPFEVKQQTAVKLK